MTVGDVFLCALFFIFDSNAVFVSIYLIYYLFNKLWCLQRFLFIEKVISRGALLENTIKAAGL